MVDVVKIKGLIAIALLVAFSATAITGIGLHFAPIGKIAKVTGWNFLGLDKYTLKTVHGLFAFATTLLTAIHVILNRKLLYAEVKHMLKR
jgi:hypothetical protein